MAGRYGEESKSQKKRTTKNIYQYGAPIGDEQYDESGYASRRDPAQAPAEDQDPSPPAAVVDKFHKNASTDSRADDIHHTLGSSSTQAAKGDHNHTGGVNGVPLLEGITLTGSKASPTTVLPSIINALVELGATDNTT